MATDVLYFKLRQSPQGMKERAILPVEVWSACWALCPRRQLRRISLVCKLFRSIVLPVLFREQSFDMVALEISATSANWMDTVRHSHRTAVRLDKLAQNPHASWVRSWNAVFSFNGAAAMSQFVPAEHTPLLELTHDRVVTTFSTTIHMYENLTSLDLAQLTVDASVRAGLASLQRIENLHLSRCKITGRDGFLRLRTLTIAGYHIPNADPLQIASPDDLRTITLDRGPEIVPLLNGFGSKTLPHLVHLSMEAVPDVEQWFRFLRQCPLLETLVVQSVDQGANQPVLQPTALSRLRVLTAPASSIQSLAPHRPISDVTILRSPSSLDVLLLVCMVIARSTVPLRTLSLPYLTPTREFLATIFALFPDLRELSMKVAGFSNLPCGNAFLWHRPSAVASKDYARPIELCDDNAFDDLPLDEISDDGEGSVEVKEAPAMTMVKKATRPHLPSETFLNICVDGTADILNWVFDDLLSLPSNLEVLRLEQDRGMWFSLADQHQTIAALGSIYPRLREVQFTSAHDNWKRVGPGEIWDSAGGSLTWEVP
ncbi:hypothetical protein B0H16DRAFT_1526743 [Mycena metata]|uniref:F-box domain-containing protein n=1 Tax=Mycena metata TaxID=1033252 RepID=A0AAD7JKB7_9AGAR|nr:hypothetical protein B0H16DRAFT_1526743 [Mycena metata]